MRIRKGYCFFIGLLSIFVFTFLYGFFVEPRSIDIHHVRVKSPGLKRLLGEKVVVHLSDLHMKELGGLEKKVIALLDTLNPDIIFLTGDYVRWKGDYEPALHFLSRLKAKNGIWAVMGDYDYSNSRQSCLFCHEAGSGAATVRHNVRFLRNAVTFVDLPEGSLQIGGMDPAEGLIPASEAVIGNMSGASAIILSHNPLGFDYVPSDRDIVMLSGDTHGGQVPLPSWLFRLTGYRKNFKYDQGLFEEGKKKLFVSRGIGTSHVPVRLCRHPEIAVLEFTE